MSAAKIYLSEEERKLVLNKEWLYLKRDVIEKVFTFLGELHDAYQEIAGTHAEAISFLPLDKTGKIARGENLEGLPYLMMDYPAVFNKKKIIAVRTLFWWGNFFSISLHLSGLSTPVINLNNWLAHFKERNFFISINEDQWNYDFNDDNFEAFKKENSWYTNHINEHGVFRVATKCSLEDWETSFVELKRSFSYIMDFLAINFRGDETGHVPGFPKEGLHP